LIRINFTEKAVITIDIDTEVHGRGREKFAN
jgi:hypothetical protein